MGYDVSVAVDVECDRCPCTTSLANVHIDFNYKCPSCKSEDVDIQDNSMVIWQNDSDGEMFEQWTCSKCGFKFQCQSKVSVVSREIYFQEVKL